MSYFNIHYGKIRESYILPKTRFEKGMLAQLTYLPKETGESKKYIVIVLNPNYKTYMHLLSLENVTYRQLNYFADMTGLKAITTIKGFKKLDISKLVMDESSYRFYNKEVKYFLDHFGVDSYRTFILSRLKQNYVLDYEFDKQILKKYGFE